MSDPEIEQQAEDLEAPLMNHLSDIPTQSLQPSTNNNGPSIFYNILYVVAFEDKIDSLRQSTDQSDISVEFGAFMLEWRGLNVRSYLEVIQEKEALVWGYYEGLDPGYRNAEKELFREYLLINSCIIIFAILSFQNVPKEKWSDPTDPERCKDLFDILDKHIKLDKPRNVKCGMLDMDRQVPWVVVEAVYEKHFGLSKPADTPINKLALSCFDDLYPGVHKSKVHAKPPSSGFKHLLHMFHWSRTPEYLVETRSLQPIQNMDSFYIPSATDLLQLSATAFEKHDGIHVSYKDRIFLSGVMQLAPLHIFQYSGNTYLNLLRFEEGYVDCGFPVTAYVACMVCLLQTEADVRLLRANGIVPSTWKDEKAVLRFVQDHFINTRTVLSDDVRMPDGLINLSKKVMAHHESISSRYYADFKSRYCPNPWTAISAVAAVCLFVLTIIQMVKALI